MEIIRKQNNQIGLSDLVVYKENGIYYTQDQSGTIKKADTELTMLLESHLNLDAFYFHA